MSAFLEVAEFFVVLGVKLALGAFVLFSTAIVAGTLVLGAVATVCTIGERLYHHASLWASRLVRTYKHHNS